MTLERIILMLVAGIGAAGFLWAFGRRHGLIGLLVLSSPIHRLSVNIGFSMKLFYLIVFAAIALNLWRATGDPFVVRTNRYLQLLGVFLAAILASAIINGATAPSVRHLIVFVIVFAGCYLLFFGVRGPADVERLTRGYLATGAFLGISGLAFYAVFWFLPGLAVPGGFFDAVTYEPERTWTLPLLQSIDVGSNGYALNLLPFMFIAMSEATRHDSVPRRRWYGFIVFGLLAVNLLLTFSRGAVLAFLFAAFLWALSVRNRPAIRWGLALVVIALLPLAPKAIELYRQYSYLKGSYSGDDERLLSGRAELITASLRVARENPVFGVGEGNITEAGYVGKQAHNTYLELLAENGAVGFAVATAIFVVLCAQVLRARPAMKDPDRANVILPYVLGMVALLVAIIPTSAITVTLLWLHATAVYAVCGVFQERSTAGIPVGPPQTIATA